jgi:predicted amidohydrolase YtcJ
MKPMTTLYRNARVFTADESAPWAEAFVVDAGKLTHVGNDASAQAAAADAAETIDLGGRLVLPGFIDAHTHVMMLGEALGKVALTDARSLPEIQERLRAAQAADPGTQRVLGRGWLFDSLPGAPTAAMIDEAVSDVPVYLDANDYHSCWVNRAALKELGITRDTPDPLGGRIGRDSHGEPDGMLYETAAQQFVWPFLAEVTSDADRDAAVERSLEAYLAAGVTGAVDMALGIRIVAHWFIHNTGDEAANLVQVERATLLAAEVNTEWLRVAGIKLALDGVIDACTAAMNQPYADGSQAGPIWLPEQLNPVVAAADAAGLQVALHAIGDHASDIALDALELAAEINGPRLRRHRIEHLEYTSPETPARMARLGVTASMQPVHADPAIYGNWVAMLGDDRPDRSFAWPEYVAAGALLAFSTDAPTAPYDALQNMFVAATRKSALDPSFPPNNPHFARPLAEAIGHATRDAAASVMEEGQRGRLMAGLAADFAVLDADPFVHGEESLLNARILRTVVAGRTEYLA